MHSRDQPWLVPMLVLMVLVVCASAQNIVESNLNKNEAEPEFAYVTQHTLVNRRKRSDSAPEDTQRDSSQLFDFADKMTFILQAKGHILVLNLTRNTLARTDLKLSDEHGEIKHDYMSRIGVYHSNESSASILVECLTEHLCTLFGSVEIKGEHFQIEPDHSSENLRFHTIKKRALPDLEELQKSLHTLQVEEDTEKRTTIGHARRRRSIPYECDIIEVKASVDNTVWEFYLAKFGGDATKAEATLTKYFYSIFAEVDFRYKCLKYYFENYDDCGIECLRVILVDLIITKTSTFTQGTYMTFDFEDGTTTTFSKAIDALKKASNINKNMANSKDGWDHFVAFTRYNFIIQDGDWYDHIRTIAWRPSMCHSNPYYRVTVTEANGDGVEIQVAHGILHALNVYNDEDKSCNKNAYFLMREHFTAKTKNKGFWGQDWYLTDCSVSAMCSYVEDLNDDNDNCMREYGSFDEDDWNEWVKTPLPGEIFSADHQCKDKWGNDSVQCDPTGEGNFFPEFMCSSHIWCTRNGSCVCNVRVSSGTPCGKAKICLKNKCVPTPDVPLGGTCDCHFQCAGNNTVCDACTCTCVCADRYFNDNGICTKKVPNDDPCDDNNECHDPNALCIDNTCQCPPCYFDDNGLCVEESCGVGGPCNSSRDCEGDNVECNLELKLCVCRDGFFVNNAGECEEGGGCHPNPNPDKECNQTNTELSDSGFCVCINGTVAVNRECYGTRVGHRCTDFIDTCTDDNARCNGTFCVCNPDFIWNDTICVGPDPCDPCDPATPSCRPDLVCSPNTYRCECPPDHVQVGDRCYGTRVTQSCTTMPNTCSDNYATCNGTVCDCVPPLVWNSTDCVGTDLCHPCDPSNDTCQDSLVCSSSTYRCECPPGYVQISDTCYGTRVTEPCTNTLDTCVDKYAGCNGTICDCEDGFIWDNHTCLGYCLCDPCDPSTPSCNFGLVCSPDTYRCECPPDEVQYGDECYGTRVTQPCTSDLDTCVDKYADCNGTICVCKEDFIWNGSDCLGDWLCEPCDPLTPSCDSSLVCSPHTYRCECPTNQVQISDECYGTRVTEPCTNNLPTCVDCDAECNGTICVCKPDFIWNGSDCVGPDPCDQCDPSTPSCGPGLVCNPNSFKCECPSDQVQIAFSCYGTLVTEPCTTFLDTCVDKYAECNGTICDCKDGFIWNGSDCLGSPLCAPCDPSTPSCDSSLVCSTDTYRCECPTNEVQYGDECYGTLVTERCTSSLSTCSNDNAECNGTICVCIAGFIWNGSDCLGHDPCDPCDPLTPTCGSGLVCSELTYRCECPCDQVQIGDNCYGTRVTELCTTLLNTCVDDYATCNGTVCDCLPGFIWNGTDCLGKKLWEPCDPLNSTCDSSLVCSPTSYTCECPPDQVQISDNCYGTRVTEECTPEFPTCIDDNAGCNGTICDCLIDFIWNGSWCVGLCLCDLCDPLTPSCDPSLVCNPDTYRCECPTNQVQYKDECYGTLVTEPCTIELDTCADWFAICNGTICDCVPGFIYNGSDCVGKYLCEPCDPLTPSCDSSLVCSSDTYRCECPPHQVQYGDNCYGTRVTEPCTTDLDTCTDKYADCNGTICDCIPGFIYNGSDCLGYCLCDPCDPLTPSCDSSLVCSSDTYRCECPPNEVQYGDECYGTRVTERCTLSLPTCVDCYAECNGTVCDCKPDFIYNGSHCVGKYLCEPCDPLTPSCDSSLVCSSDTYRCECPPNQVQYGDNCYGTHVTEPCTNILNTCVDKYSVCNGTVCVCKDDFIWNGSKCLGYCPCDPCDPLTPSCNFGLVCSSDTYRCECPPNQVLYGDECYGTRVTEVCTSELDTCSDKNADCNGTICDCVEGFIWNGYFCAGECLCDPCDPSDSTCSIPLVCSNDTSRCECPPDRVQIGDDCYGTRVTEPCTSILNTCVDDCAFCNGTVCDCLPGHYWNGSDCLGEDLCAPCDPFQDTCDACLVCNPSTYRCECPPDEVQIGDNCYGTRVNELCTPELSTCVDYYAECNGTVCVCPPGWIWNETDCSGICLCDPCDPATNSCAPHLVCNSNTYRCECPPSQVQFRDECYGTRVTELCTGILDTCSDNFAECNGTVCDCLPGFTWNGIVCVGVDPGNPCSPINPCPGDLLCLNTSVCGCPSDRVRIADTCYGTLVTEPCTPFLDTCVDKYADCNGTICDCVDGFVWNGSYCGGKVLCEPCDPLASTCDPELVCSPITYRCECPTHQVQVVDICVGTRVTEECSPIINTCIDDFAVCNGTICNCIPDFIWNGSKCVGYCPCDPCDPFTPSCNPSLVCSPDTYRCECPPNQVLYGDECYGTRVTEPCTNALDTCIDDNAGCNGTACDCDPGFSWNGLFCAGECLCDPCDPSDSTCSTPLVCSNDTSRCECPPDRVQIGDDCYGTLFNEPCTPTLDTCVDKHAACNGTVCDCEDDFMWNGSKCVGKYLCHPCDPLTPSCDSSLVCNPDTYRCECPLNQVQYGDACYGTRVTEECTTELNTCFDYYAECNGTVCDCIPGFIWNGSCCGGSLLCEPCDPLTPSCDPWLVCSSDTYRCECPPGEVQIGDECYGRFVTELCTPILDTCVDDNAFCNGTVCDCEPGFHWNGSWCGGQCLCEPCDPLTPTCDPSLVCSPDTYRCECPPHQVQYGDECYGTRVTEPCTPSLPTCVDKHAECNGTVCDCGPGFIWNGSDCVGHLLCHPCDPLTPSCEPHLVCSSNTYRCECPSNLVQIADDCYGTLVTEKCTPFLDTCIDDYAGCNGTVCDCLPDFIWNGSRCVGDYFWLPCDPLTPSCGSPLVCNPNTYLCECPPGYVQIDGACYGTRVTEWCTPFLDTCIDHYAECNGTICDCQDDFIWNGSRCVGTFPCDPCDPLTPSCDPSLVCSSDTYRCECPPGEVQYGDECYGTRVTESCTTILDTCIDDYAGCNGTICDCLPDFIWNGSRCVGPGPCDPCDPLTPSCGAPFVCNPSSYVCECPPGQVQVGDMCELCTSIKDTCVDDNAECNGTVCDCVPGFIYNGTKCVGMEPCDPCDPATLPCGAGFVCSPSTYICECPSDRVRIGDTCYGTRVTELCTITLDTCIDDYAGCNGTICDCLPDSSWNGSRCVGKYLCYPCDPLASTCESDLVCSSTTYRCECPPDEVQIGDNCYGTHVTDPCTPILNTCIDKYAECNGTVCDCKAGFVWNGSRCLGMLPCEPCDPLTPSCDPSLVCSSDTYRCECPHSQVQIGDNCYGTLVTEVCTNIINTCVDLYAECNGTICDCKPGFIYNGSDCLGRLLCEPCDPSMPTCVSDLVCSSNTYRCECPTHQVQVGDNCFGTRVTEPCTNNPDTCSDKNADCNGTVCDCVPDFIYNGTDCVGSALCAPCDPSTLACEPGLVCDPDTYTCACPYNRVQFAGACYGTLVTEPCTPDLNTCIDYYAECNGTTCDCIPDFVWNGTKCVASGLWLPCDPSTLACEDDLVCSPDTYQCECPFGFVQVADRCYGRLIGENCTTSPNTCIDDNAECSGGNCACIPPFYFNFTLRICVGNGLDEPCDANSCGPGLACGTTSGNCECENPPIQIDHACYGKFIGENCTVTQDTCIDDNAECSAGVCSCIPEFTWNNLTCVGKKLDDPCDHSPDSCIANDLVCGPHGKCECPGDEVQVNNTCYSLTCDPCTSNEDCLDANQVCLHDICQCDHDYYLDNCSICQPKVGNDGPCLADEECISGICACGQCVASLDDDCCEDCENIQADIVIIIDATASEERFEKIQGFANTIVNSFVVSPTDVQIGVASFSDVTIVSDSFNMNVETSNLEVTNRITTSDRSIVDRKTHIGINRTRIYFDSGANRNSIPNYAILLTDGPTNSEVSRLNNNVNELKAISNMTVFAVGIDNQAPLSELQSIATDNSKAFQDDTFSALTSIVTYILDNSCSDD